LGRNHLDPCLVLELVSYHRDHSKARRGDPSRGSGHLGLAGTMQASDARVSVLVTSSFEQKYAEFRDIGETCS